MILKPTKKSTCRSSNEDAMLILCIEELDNLIGSMLALGDFKVSSVFLDWATNSLTNTIESRIRIALRVGPFAESLRSRTAKDVLKFWVRRWAYSEILNLYPQYISLIPIDHREVINLQAISSGL